jgi:predicted nucleic acid-binding protein
MGLILDSSVVIASERAGEASLQLLEKIAAAAGDQRVAISAIGLAELVHAIFRAQTPQIRSQREAFVRDLVADVEVVPFAESTAWLAGKIDGTQRALGITSPSSDLLIGATALELGYSVATLNLRHFRMIPGLSMIAL